MQNLAISLFGKMSVSYDDQPVEGCDGSKVQELLCYLSINRDRPHSREVIASLLWGDYCTTAQSKKYLRKALWQLQSALGSCIDVAGSGLLQVDAEWITLHTIENIYIDVERLETAYELVRGIEGQDLCQDLARSIEEVESLYSSKLLEGWYQEWCLCERERLHLMYLTLLEKLMVYHESKQEYLRGLEYGLRILGYDRAREFTHRQIMRLYALAGKRTDALYQYQKCKAALHEELAVEPSRSTRTLYEAIRNDLPIQGAIVSPVFQHRDVTQALLDMQTGMDRLQTRLKGVLESLHGSHHPGS